MVLTESPAQQGIWGMYKFEVNNNVKDCDYWVIYEDIDGYLFEAANCPPGNTILVTGEEKTMWSYPQDYLEQFGAVFTSRDDIKHSNVIRGAYLCPWHVKRSYDTLISTSPEVKKADLSVICSNSISLDGHRRRLAFVEQLKVYFKEQLHWFGKGKNPVADKWDGLSPFRYSVAIENAAHPHYFTEKINDCFLAYTMPLYWGCQNLEEYFPAESFVRIDINNYQRSIRLIEQAVRENWYEKYFEAICESRKRVLERYQFFPALSSMLDQFVAVKPSKRQAKSLK